MVKSFLIILFNACFTFFALAQNVVYNELQKILEQPEYRNSLAGVHFVNPETALTAFEYNAEKLLIPASVLKLVTSAAALEILGSGYRFKTTIGYTGEINRNNILQGDLVIVGGGDPTLGSEYFNENTSYTNFIKSWVQKIKEAGIKTIEGDIILDGSIYDSEKIPPTWIWTDLANYYGAGASAFTCYDNSFTIKFKSPKTAGEKTEIISIYPKLNGTEIINEVVASNDNRDLAYVFGSPFEKKRVISGTIPKNRNAFTIKAALHQPEELIAQELLHQLAVEGVFITGKSSCKTIDKRLFQPIFVFESVNLSEIINVINHKSVNLFAEHLVKQIAYEKTGFGTRIKGIEIITEFLKSKGLATDSFFMEDGSGLSHFNAVSPKQITDLLVYMHANSKLSDVFIHSLPDAGTGTLSGFKKSSLVNGALKAKSGSMTRVRCYAGYLILDSGDKMAFTIMFNNFAGPGSKLANEIENLLVAVKKSM